MPSLQDVVTLRRRLAHSCVAGMVLDTPHGQTPRLRGQVHDAAAAHRVEHALPERDGEFMVHDRLQRCRCHRFGCAPAAADVGQLDVVLLVLVIACGSKCRWCDERVVAGGRLEGNREPKMAGEVGRCILCVLVYWI